jgi:hypothetical protein
MKVISTQKLEAFHPEMNTSYARLVDARPCLISSSPLLIQIVVPTHKNDLTYRVKIYTSVGKRVASER